MTLWTTKLESPHDPSTVCLRLRQAVRPPKGFWQDLKESIRSQPEAFAFEGSIGERDFTVRRIIRGRNSFLPEVRGSIGSREAGSLITVRIAIHPGAVVFLVVWFGALLQPFVRGGMSLGDEQAPIFVLMALFGALFVVLPFLYEAWMAEKLLGDIVGAA